MKNFAQLQTDFQRAILLDDNEVLSDLLDSPKERRAVLLGVYRNAYVLRLLEALGTSYELLRHYVGNAMFDDLGRAYIVEAPSEHPNMRWYGGSLPRFLAQSKPYADYPILTELAGLETALNDAFDAKDDPVVTIAALGTIDPALWQDLVFAPHGSVRRLDHTTNAFEIWSALRADEPVPPARTLSEPTHILVWRREATAMVRSMTSEEAMMWDEAVQGVAFGHLCTMLATFDDADGAPARAAGYLGQWIDAGQLRATQICAGDTPPMFDEPGNAPTEGVQAAPAERPATS